MPSYLALVTLVPSMTLITSKAHLITSFHKHSEHGALYKSHFLVDKWDSKRTEGDPFETAEAASLCIVQQRRLVHRANDAVTYDRTEELQERVGVLTV